MKMTSDEYFKKFQNMINLSIAKAELEIEGQIGQGGFAKVYKVHSQKYDEHFALKIFPLNLSATITESFKREIDLLMSLNHPNIIKIYREFNDSAFAYIIMELCQGGSLLDYVKKHFPLTPNQIGQFSFQLAAAIQFCHKMGIAHNDIKPHNVLLDNNDRVRLTDFGISTKQEEDQAIILKTGSLAYMAPERLMGKPFNPFKADIWALGVTIYYLSQGKTPWCCDTTENVKSEILSFSLSIPATMNKNIGTIIAKLMKHDPYMRIQLEDLMDNDFMKQFTSGFGDRTRIKLQPAATNFIMARRGSRLGLSSSRQGSIANLKRIGTLGNIGSQLPKLKLSSDSILEVE